MAIRYIMLHIELLHTNIHVADWMITGRLGGCMAGSFALKQATKLKALYSKTFSRDPSKS